MPLKAVVHNHTVRKADHDKPQVEHPAGKLYAMYLSPVASASTLLSR